MRLPRHTLVDLRSEVREHVAQRVGDGLLAPYRLPELRQRAIDLFAHHAIPGIACRPTQTIPDGFIQLGVALPFRHQGSRVRALIAVADDTVAGHRSPYELLAAPIPADGPRAALLDAVNNAAAIDGVRLGAFGSTALHLATGLPYVEPQSDLDLVACAPSLAALTDFFAAAVIAGARHGVRLDIEVALSNGYGVKAKELLSHSKTVLGRSLDDVRLFDRAEAHAAIAPTAAIIPAAEMPQKPDQTTRRLQWT